MSLIGLSLTCTERKLSPWSLHQVGNIRFPMRSLAPSKSTTGAMRKPSLECISTRTGSISLSMFHGYMPEGILVVVPFPTLMLSFRFFFNFYMRFPALSSRTLTILLFQVHGQKWTQAILPYTYMTPHYCFIISFHASMCVYMVLS